MFVLLHWWNNLLTLSKKKSPPSHLTPEPLPVVKILISIIEKKINEYYVEFDFWRGTVLVIFSILWIDNDILPLERKCLLRSHIPAISIPTLGRLVQTIIRTIFLKPTDILPNNIMVTNLSIYIFFYFFILFDVPSPASNEHSQWQPFLRVSCFVLALKMFITKQLHNTVHHNFQ